MKVAIHGHGVEVTGTLRSHAEKKLSKILKYFTNIQKIDIELEFRPIHETSQSHVAQITVAAKGTLLRAEERSADMYSSIDMAFHRLEQQIKKYKEKRISTHRRERKKEKEALIKQNEMNRAHPAAAFDGSPRIRVKHFPVKPVSPEEAVQRMEMVGHDFYVFRNSDTDQVNVVYRRRNGQFGLIEPE